MAQAMVTEPADGARLGSGSRRGRENRVEHLFQGGPLSCGQAAQNFVHRLQPCGFERACLPFTCSRYTQERGSPGAVLAFDKAPAHKTVQDPHGSWLGNTSNFREDGCRGVPVVIQGKQERGSARGQLSTCPFQAVGEKDGKRAKFVGEHHMHSLCMNNAPVKDNAKSNLWC